MSGDPYSPKRIARPRRRPGSIGSIPVDRLLRLGASTAGVVRVRDNLAEITDPDERAAALDALAVATDPELSAEIAELQRDLRAERDPMPDITGTSTDLAVWAGTDADRAARVLAAERDRASDAGKAARAGLVRAMEKVIRG